MCPSSQPRVDPEIENLASMVRITTQAIKNAHVLLRTINPQAEMFLRRDTKVEGTVDGGVVAVDVNRDSKDGKENVSAEPSTPESKLRIQPPTDASVNLESAVRDRIKATNNGVLLEREQEKGGSIEFRINVH